MEHFKNLEKEEDNDYNCDYTGYEVKTYNPLEEEYE